MFSPLAFTLGYALLGSLILSLTYVPAMCKLLLTKNIEEKENFISRFFRVNIYRIYEFSDRHKKDLSLVLLLCWLFVDGDFPITDQNFCLSLMKERSM